LLKILRSPFDIAQGERSDVENVSDFPFVLSQIEARILLTRMSMDAFLFQTDHARLALEKYAAVTHMTVRVYDRDEQIITAVSESNPLFELFRGAQEPAIVLECVRRCLAQAEGPAVVVQDAHGLAIVGTPFTNEGEVICVGVIGLMLTKYLGQREIERLARDTGVAYLAIWSAVRKGLPIPSHRLPVYGELLRILGETLLSEHHRSRQLEEALARLEAADRSKDEFLANLSHELRGPLNAITGWTRVLRVAGLDAAVSAGALEAIEQSAQDQTRLTNDLLDVSRIIAGKLRLDLQRVELLPAMETALDAIRPAADAKNVGLQIQLDPSVGPVSGDPERLGQVFSNLLSNAVKFTPAGGGITVKLERNDSEAIITVSDTGKGIRSDFLPHIFERFWQADSTITRLHGGLGLGLAIVQNLVELHGGSVRAESRGEDQGASFIVSLPLLKVWREARDTPKPFSSPSPTLHDVCVWVVDDDPSGRSMLKMMLEMSGAQVTELASANETLKMLDESKPEILVCDLSMPEVDGYTLMRQVRSRGPERGGSVPAIAVTGYAALEHRERALSAGYQAYFAKPIDPYELARMIARLTEHEL
jgi:signal transduction histidine kinase/CheY-like chemotaxis protein